MKCDLVLAGVGGQGILSLAGLIAAAAVREGWWVRQSEIHGMSQRGGSVLAQVRLADHQPASDLIPRGSADLLVSMEMLEGLRYLDTLGPGSRSLCSREMISCGDGYPQEAWLEEQWQHFSPGPLVLVDVPRLARQAGSPKTGNVVLAGVASQFLPLEAQTWIATLEASFGAKGPAMVELNLRGFDLGRQCGAAEGRAT